MEKFMTGVTPLSVMDRRPPLSKGSSLGSIGDLPTRPCLSKTGSLDSADILNWICSDEIELNWIGSDENWIGSVENLMKIDRNKIKLN